MGAARLVIVLAVAAIAALALALLVRSMTAAHKPPPAVVVAAPVEKPMTRVLVARKDLKVADHITADVLAWQPWPADSVNPSYITGGSATVPHDLAAKAASALQNVTRDDAAIQALNGSMAREPILANEPITQRKLVRGGEGGFLAVKLPAGMRAMSIPVTAESGAGGFVLPGDRVDVVLNLKNQPGADGGKSVSSRLVMRNIKVLAIDQNTEPKQQQPSMIGSTATLEVPSTDIDSLARAKAQGDLILVLRSYADAAGPSGRVGPASNLDLGDVVRVYRAGQISEVRVAR